jgi:hypothetical protein
MIRSGHRLAHEIQRTSFVMLLSIAQSFNARLNLARFILELTTHTSMELPWLAKD